MNWMVFVQALPIILVMGVITWIISLVKKDVGVVDVLWPLMFLAAAIFYASNTPDPGMAQWGLFSLVIIWSLRLSIHLLVRNWGEPEDRRYAAIRANNQPGFGFKSLYLIFGLQGLLSWIIGITLFVGLTGSGEFGTLQVLGAALWLIGFVFEAIGDYQLLRFKKQSNTSGQVLRSGLWRYTRHPNYFGEFLIWWGFYCFTMTTAPVIGLIGPLFMSYLLMKFSGVPMLEKDITKRRGDYGDYIRQTNAFFPGPPKGNPTEA